MKRLLIFWIGLVIGLTGLQALQNISSGSSSRIEIDATIESGSSIEVYVNQDYYMPYRVPIRAAVPTVYSVPDIDSNIRELRIDFGKVNGAAIELRRVDIFVGDRLVRHYGPDALRKIIEAQPDALTGPLRDAPSGIFYVQKGEGPSFLSSEPIKVEGSGVLATIISVASNVQSGRVVLQFSLAAFAVLLITSAGSGYLRFLMLVGAAAGLLTVLIVPRIVLMIDVPDSTRLAVGHAAFSGRSTLANQVALWAAVAGAVLIGATAILVAKRFRFSFADARTLETVAPDRDRQRWLNLVALICVFFILCYFLGGVVPWIDGEAKSLFSAHWDSENIILWKFLAYEGYHPLLDYWYPYGGYWLFSLPAPAGQLYQMSYHAAIYATLFLSLYLILQRRVHSAAMITFTVVVAEAAQIVKDDARYLICINIVLSYIAIGKLRDRMSFRHLLFFGAVAMAVIFEPLQIWYASAAIFVYLAHDFVRGARELRGWVRRLAIEAGPCIVIGVVAVLVWWSRGELEAIVAFDLSIPVGATYSSIPSDLKYALESGVTADSISLIAPVTMIAVGLIGSAQPRSERQAAGLVLLMLGLTSLMMLQKSIIRDMPTTVLLPIALGLLIWAVMEPRHRRPVPLLIGGILFGAAIASRPDARAMVSRLLAGPRDTVLDLHTLITAEEPVRSARRDAFAPRKFESFRAENNVVARLRALGAGPSAPVYVLGDAPILYILLRQLPPYQSNDYNASPVFEQRRVAEWLRATKPAFVAWRFNDLSFDGFARAVRVPLIYGAVAANYVPVEIVEGYAILRRRQNGEPAAAAWWGERLTPTVELGQLLRRTGTADLPECDAANRSACMRVLRVQLAPELRDRQRISIRVDVAGQPIEVAFVASPQQESYEIALEHTWFWPVACAQGAEPKVEPSSDPRIRIAEIWKKRSDDLLY